MASVECLREFVNERLTAAAEEIFGVFKRTIVEYEEEIDRQRRLLNIVLKPQIRLHRIEFTQQHVCKEEDVLSDQQLCNQESNSSLDQEDPVPPKIKEEQEEISTSQEREHKRTVRSGTQGPYLCGTCGKCFSRKYSLKKHNKIHTGEKPYTCKTCGKSFRLGNYLTIHMRTHTGEKPFTCKTCSKSFSAKTNLIAHMRIHTGERPHPCITCGKRFFKMSDLNRHKRIHRQEKRFTCKICANYFRLSYDLIVHMRAAHSCETLSL